MSEINKIVINYFNTPELSSREQVDIFLQKNFRDKLTCPLSEKFPENSHEHDEDYSAYIKYLAEYQTSLKDLKFYDGRNPKEIKRDFVDKNNINIGWKLHLNVEPKFVNIVSGYLKDNGYAHKYLSGGEDGKTFTIYLGSYKLAEKLSKIISENLRNYLAKPLVDNNELEFAPGVVGRFVGSKNMTADFNFHQYGSCGFSWKSDDAKKLLPLLSKRGTPGYEQEYKKIKKDAEINAFQALLRVYGDYFFTVK